MNSATGVGGPLDLLKLLLNSSVTVQLKDASSISGLLRGFDEHCNLLLYKPSVPSFFCDILFVRGDLVILIRES
jgi:small nuclear ribonucleoprotein (snRNP)-like protein